jgi:hypothetical protein
MNSILETVTLEDGKTCAVIDEISDNDITYVYLTNVEDETDFYIRKLKDDPAGKLLVGLSNDEEFDRALAIFAKKYNN